ncbi:MAG: hypothetical protein ACRCSZ_07390 [Lactococcus lactis]
MVKALKEINEMVDELNAIGSDCNTLADEIDWSEVSDKVVKGHLKMLVLGH